MPRTNVRAPGSPPLPRGLASVLAVGLCACGGRGEVTFRIDAPTRADLSPFSDDRRESASLIDELTRLGIGSPVNLRAPAGARVAMGEVPVGRYDLRLQIAGGSQLIGLARTPGVEVPAGRTVDVELHARKPLAFWGSRREFAQETSLDPSLLMALDTTLPPVQSGARLIDAVPDLLTAQVRATTPTRDGRYLLVAGDGLAVMRTDELTIIGVQALGPAPGKAGKVVARRVIVSPDDKWFAVITDHGVHVASLPDLIARGLSVTLPPIPLENAIAGEFNPAGTAVTVLTGPSWDALDCPLPSTPSNVYTIPVEGAVSPGTPTAAPSGTTDLAWHPSLGLLYAVACGDGIVTAGPGPRTVLSGTHMFDVAVAGERVYSVEGDIKRLLVEFDPDNPLERNTMLPFFELASSLDGRRLAVPFRIRRYEPTFTYTVVNPGPDKPQRKSFQKKLDPVQVDAYSISISPDSSRATITFRLRYRVPFSERKIDDVISFDGLGNPEARRYHIDAVRDLYYVAVVDTNGGSGEFLQPAAIAEPEGPCAISGEVCDRDFKNCRPEPSLDQTCAAVESGYVPDGLSVLLGYN